MDANSEHKKGIEFAEKGAFDAAIESFSNIIRLEPHSARAHYNRGLAQSKTGEFVKAIADFDEAIRLKPDLAAAYNNRGLAKKDKGELDQAVADFDEAIRLNPSYARAYRNRGIAYEASGNHKKAQADFTKAKELSNPKRVRQGSQAIFSDTDSRCIMERASREAQRFNHEHIGPGHVLLALLSLRDGVAICVLRRLEVDVQNVRIAVETSMKSGPDPEMIRIGSLPPSPETRAVLEYANDEARNLGHNYVDSQHILLGLLHEPTGQADLFSTLGVTLEQARAEVGKIRHTQSQVESEFTERLAAASWWQRQDLEWEMAVEYKRRMEQLAPPDALN